VNIPGHEVRFELRAGHPQQEYTLTAKATPLCLIVVPCYNEGSRLQVARFTDFLRKVEGVNFLFVNDGSRDNTLDVLQTIRSGREDRIQILDKQPNAGKAEAVRTGLQKAIEQGQGTYVGFWDADLSTPLEVIPDFLALLNGSDQFQMVFGSRVRLLGRDVARKASRHYLGRVFASFASITLGLPIYDTQCGAKLFRVTPELASILKEKFLSRWVFDVEILARYIAFYQGSVAYLRESIYEFPLPRWYDVDGSKVRSGDFFKAALDLFRIYRTYLARGDNRRSNSPITVSPATSGGTLRD
jgi:dolichyl-phosphate beta-glucosyltransferase